MAFFVLSQVAADGCCVRAVLCAAPGRGWKGAVSHVGRGRRCRGAPRRLTQSFYERFTSGFERSSSRPFRTRNVLQTHAVVPPSSPFSAGALPGSARLVLRARRFPRLRFFPALLSLARIPSAPASPAPMPSVLSIGVFITFRITITYEAHRGDPSVFRRHCPSTALQGVE